MSRAVPSMLDASGGGEPLAQTVARAITGVVPDTCIVALTSDDNTAIVPAAIHDEDASVIEAYQAMMGVSVPLSASSIAARVISNGIVFIPEIDYENLPGQAASIALMKQVGMRGLIVAPLYSRDDLIGLVTVMRHRPERPAFDDLDKQFVENLAIYAGLAFANERLFTERDRLTDEVAASRFLDAVIENIPDMVFVKDAEDLRFVRFNRAGEELLGLPRHELIGKNDNDFFPPEEARFFIAKDRQALASKSLVDIPEEPIQTPSGQRWLHTKKVPILDDTGAPRYLLGISEDITDRKRAIAALNAAKEAVEAANRELESFSYSVAHDLRAPLRAVDGFAQALLEDFAGKKLDEIGVRHLERIRAAANRMSVLIDDLLRLSRITRYEHRLERVDVSAICRVVVAQLERADPDRKVEVVIAPGITANADPKLLAIVFDNLIGNAWKFTSKVQSPRIEIGSKREQGQLVIYVRDNGAGFDMTYQNKLFGVFQRLHPMHEFPGTGVGLATVKRIVERHGGRVWAEGAVGSGATFYVSLGDGP